MPSKPQRYPNESVIAKWLRDAGYSRVDVASTLGISYRYLCKCLHSPKDYITVRQMWILSGMTQRPFVEIFYAIVNQRGITFKRTIDETFKDMTGLNIDTANEPETE